MARVAHAAGFRSNSGNGIIAGLKGRFFGYFSFRPLGKRKVRIVQAWYYYLTNLGVNRIAIVSRKKV
jgi:hypothetical protein